MNILITGASQGIGREIAKRFAFMDNMKLYLLSRSLEKLKSLQEECRAINEKTRIEILPFDLEQLVLESSLLDIKEPHLDIVINNAGSLIKKNFRDLTNDDIVEMSTVNFLSPVILIRSLLPKLGKNGNSHIVNISSMAGFQGSLKFPGLSIYSASKAALASFSECLAQELKGTNIFTNCLAIGSVQTDMLAKAFPGLKAPLTAPEMAEFICDFAINGYRYFNGKILPVTISNP